MAMVGCQSVDSTAMLGQPSETVAKAVNGVWKLNDAVFYAKALGHDGQVQLASVQWKKDKWQMQTYTLYATTLGDQAYLNLSTQTGDQAKADSVQKYHFMKLLYDVKSGQKPKYGMVILNPKLGSFVDAVKDGKLPGKVDLDKKTNEPTNVHLTATAEALAAFVQGNHNQKLFDEEHPQMLLRLK